MIYLSCKSRPHSVGCAPNASFGTEYILPFKCHIKGDWFAGQATRAHRSTMHLKSDISAVVLFGDMHSRFQLGKTEPCAPWSPSIAMRGHTLHSTPQTAGCGQDFAITPWGGWDSCPHFTDEKNQGLRRSSHLVRTTQLMHGKPFGKGSSIPQVNCINSKSPEVIHHRNNLEAQRRFFKNFVLGFNLVDLIQASADPVSGMEVKFSLSL